MVKATLHLGGIDKPLDSASIPPGQKITFMIQPQLPGRITEILFPGKGDEVEIVALYDKKGWRTESPGHLLETAPMMNVSDVIYMDLVNKGKTTAQSVAPVARFLIEGKRAMPIGWKAVETPEIHQQRYQISAAEEKWHCFSTTLGKNFKAHCFHIVCHDEEPADLRVGDIRVGRNSQLPSSQELAVEAVSGVPFDFDTLPAGMEISLYLYLRNHGKKPATVSVTVEGTEVQPKVYY